MGLVNEVYDVTVIGGGTTGMFIAQYSGMRGLKTKVIEAKHDFGGKVSLFFPEKSIYDIGGIPEITGNDLLTKMKQQACKHNPPMINNEWIEVIEKRGGQFELTSIKGNKHYSKTVIIATGMGSFDVVSSQFVHQTYKNLHQSLQYMDQFKNKKVMISSNNRIGIDWALTLEKFAHKVHLVNSRETFQHASEEELKKLSMSSVDLRVNASVKHVYTQDGCVVGVTIRSDKGIEDAFIDHMLVYDGVKLNPTPFKNWGLDTEKGRVCVDASMATTIDGIFAAGDSTIYPNKTMLIATGYTEGITAVNSAKKYMDPSASGQVYSTVIYRNK